MSSFSTSGSKALSFPLAAAISVLAHLLFFGCLFLYARREPEPEPEVLRVSLLSEPPAPPAPALPVLELPAPEPPAPEPPKPELPAPEPPAPEPPAPEPPKPAPPKPEPPKPTPPKPQPTPPKPVSPKPAPPKPQPAPPKPPSAPSLQERIRAAEVKTVQSQPREQSRPAIVSNPDDIRRRLTRDVVTQRTSARALAPSGGRTAAQQLADTEAVDYAGRVLNPVVGPLWNAYGPNKGELGNVLPSSVELELVVLENGQIISIAIHKRSNLAAMNQAAEKLMAALRSRRLTSLPAAGIKSPRLEILLTLNTTVE